MIRADRYLDPVVSGTGVCTGTNLDVIRAEDIYGDRI